MNEAQEWEYGSALRQAEHRIQRILIDLEEETGKRIGHVEVDTRNFAQLRTEIHFEGGDEYDADDLKKALEDFVDYRIKLAHGEIEL